jgi:hypothetical protein
MSALPPNADIGRGFVHVRYGVLFGSPAIQVTLQRAQRTVRPAGPTEAWSIM